MKRYQCDKTVHAFRIVGIKWMKSSFILCGPSGEEVEVMSTWGPQEMMSTDLIDGYYIRYSKDFSSWLSAQAFEELFSEV